MALNANLPNFYIQWPNDAASTLIHHRRAYQIYFCTTPMQQQWRAGGYGEELHGRYKQRIQILRLIRINAALNGMR